MPNVINPNDITEFEDKRTSGFVGIVDSEDVVYYEFTAPNGALYSTRPQAYKDQATKDNVKANFITQLENEDFS